MRNSNLGFSLFFALSCGMAWAAGSEEHSAAREWRHGDDVALVGRISPIPHQHMIQSIPGRLAIYVDVTGIGQIVAYVAGEFTCQNRVSLRGKVIDTSGRSKRPGDTRIVGELQLNVAKWSCLN